MPLSPTFAPSEHGKMPPHLCPLGRLAPSLACTMVSSLNSLPWQMRSLHSHPNSPVSCPLPGQPVSARKMLTVPCTCPGVSHCCRSARLQPGMLFSPSPPLPMNPSPPSKTNSKWCPLQSLSAPLEQSPASLPAAVTSTAHPPH